MNDSVLRAILATPDHRCECRAIRWSDADDVRQQAALDALTLDEVDSPEAMARFKVSRAACDIARREMAACRGRSVLVNECDSDGPSRLEAQADTDTPLDEILRREDDAQLGRAIASLTPDQQRVIRYRYWESLTVPETAAEMGLSESAVGGLLKRALRSLRVRYAS